jgi:acetoin:2,6-dichlorophenolindophenol oxidoreductase subunit beta
MRKISYGEAIREATFQVMKKDKKVFVIGQGVWSPWYVGKTCEGLVEKFKEERVVDTPVSEGAITGAATGAALAGNKPILIFPRMDFMYLALDQIINQAANWSYMLGGKVSVPLVIRGIINRGGEQAAQHSQAIQAIFAHIPGLKVVMPSTPYDAKGLLISAIKDKNPVVYIEDRWLYSQEGEVPSKIYSVPIGKAKISRKGKDVTLIAVSYMIPEAIKAAQELTSKGIEVEVIDLRSIKPLDKSLISKSVKKTGRLVVADVGWQSFGISSEIAKVAYQETKNNLKSPVKIVALPDTPAPASSALEKYYYPNKNSLKKAIKNVLK